MGTFTTPAGESVIARLDVPAAADVLHLPHDADESGLHHLGGREADALTYPFPSASTPAGHVSEPTLFPAAFREVGPRPALVLLAGAIVPIPGVPGPDAAPDAAVAGG